MTPQQSIRRQNCQEAPGLNFVGSSEVGIGPPLKRARIGCGAQIQGVWGDGCARTVEENELTVDGKSVPVLIPGKGWRKVQDSERTDSLNALIQSGALRVLREIPE